MSRLSAALHMYCNPHMYLRVPDPPPPPQPKPEIHPDYPRKEYRIVVDEGGAYTVESRLGTEDWVQYKNPATSKFDRLGPRLSEVYRAPSESFARGTAKALADSDYRKWLLVRRAGTIINLGNLP